MLCQSITIDAVAIARHWPQIGGLDFGWARAGTGKRGGARVIYFYHNRNRPLYLLMVYAKARRENLTPEERKAVRKLAALLKG